MALSFRNKGDDPSTGEQSFQAIQRKREKWTTVFRLAIFLIWLGFTAAGWFPVTISIALPIIATLYGALSVFVCFRLGLNRLWITGFIVIDIAFVTLVTGALGAVSSYVPLLYATIVVGHTCGSGRLSGLTATALSILTGVGLLLAEASGVSWFRSVGVHIGPSSEGGGYLSAAVILAVGLSTIYFFLDLTLSLLENYAGQERQIREREQVSSRQAADLQRRSEQTYRLEALGRLAGGIAHDFNNLLTGILVYMQELQQELNDDDPRRVDVTDVINAAQRAAELTAQLLAFSRRRVIHPRVVDLHQMLTELHRMLSRIIGEHIVFLLQLAPSLRCIRVDPAQAEQVVMNLVLNAKDAMPDGGTLTVAAINIDDEHPPGRNFASSLPAGSFVRISVTDTGPGIDESIRDRIFEPFFTTKPDGLGSGLGLPTVYGILQQHGGAIDIDSVSGAGCTVHVYFPATDEASEPSNVSPISPTEAFSETILLVEDEPVVRRSLLRVLKRAGHRVMDAASGEEAMQIMKQSGDAVSLVLTDVIMPGMSGRELANRLRQQHPDLPILYMSGYTDNVIVPVADIPTNDLFIAKPFDADTLLKAIHRIRSAVPSS